MNINEKLPQKKLFILLRDALYSYLDMNLYSETLNVYHMGKFSPLYSMI